MSDRDSKKSKKKKLKKIVDDDDNNDNDDDNNNNITNNNDDDNVDVDNHDDSDKQNDDDNEGDKDKRKRKRKRKSKNNDNDNDDNNDDNTNNNNTNNSNNLNDNGIDEYKVVAGSESFNNDRTIYIEGLPFTATEKDITEFFKSVGKVLSIRLPKWHDSGKLRGYGHVEFPTSELATKALELDGTDMKNRYIKVQRPKTPRIFQSIKDKEKVQRPVGCQSVFVKNLPYDTNEDEVKEAFMVCGPVNSVRLAVWGHTQQLKGFGYIDFKREDSAEIAVKKSGTLSVKGRKVIIDFETGSQKASFKPRR